MYTNMFHVNDSGTRLVVHPLVNHEVSGKGSFKALSGSSEKDIRRHCKDLVLSDGATNFVTELLRLDEVASVTVTSLSYVIEIGPCDDDGLNKLELKIGFLVMENFGVFGFLDFMKPTVFKHESGEEKVRIMTASIPVPRKESYKEEWLGKSLEERKKLISSEPFDQEWEYAGYADSLLMVNISHILPQNAMVVSLISNSTLYSLSDTETGWVTFYQSEARKVIQEKLEKHEINGKFKLLIEDILAFDRGSIKSIMVSDDSIIIVSEHLGFWTNYKDDVTVRILDYVDDILPSESSFLAIEAERHASGYWYNQLKREQESISVPD